jgi:hypothetical protein
MIKKTAFIAAAKLLAKRDFKMENKDINVLHAVKYLLEVLD